MKREEINWIVHNVERHFPDFLVLIYNSEFRAGYVLKIIPMEERHSTIEYLIGYGNLSFQRVYDLVKEFDGYYNAKLGRYLRGV